MPALAPDAEAVSVSTDYAARAIEATGGLDAWIRTKQVQLDCVVTFYQPDGSHYLTEQRYAVYPWSNSIRISANEPQGTLVWQLSNGQFRVLQGGDRIAELSKEASGKCFAEAVLNITTAPARFLDDSAQFAKQNWYYPIERQPRPGAASAGRLTPAAFYQDRDNSLIDMLQFSCTDTGKSLIVRGYDYDRIEKAGPLLPARIEIFSTDAQGSLQERLVKIDCHKWGSAK
ncbi:MAG: hypothetical protein ACYSUD_20975 [Planctomycetota bacterium]